MFVNPVLVGVFGTLFIELCILIIASIYLKGRGK